MKNFVLSETKTLELARSVAKCLQRGLVVELKGPLGVGKTTFVRGVLLGLGYSGIARSPTYTLVEEYIFPSFILYHFDLYRLKAPSELEFIGLADYFNGQHVIMIEWPEKGKDILPLSDVSCDFQRVKEETRFLRWRANTKRGEIFLNCLRED